MKVFSLLDMDEFIREAGAKRVNEEASIKLRDLLEDSGKEILLKAKFLANYAGRKEIRREDILLAVQYIKHTNSKKRTNTLRKDILKKLKKLSNK